MSLIQAMPKMAMAATMPDLKTTPFGTVCTWVRVASRMMPPKPSMNIWMMTLMSIGFSMPGIVRMAGSMATTTMLTSARMKSSTELRAAGGSSSFRVVLVVLRMRSRQTGSCMRRWYSGSSFNSLPRRRL